LKIAKKKSRKNKPLTERELLKMEIAKEMGIWEQVEKDGWQSLTNATCGRVGGIMRKRLQKPNSLTQSSPVFIENEYENNPV